MSLTPSASASLSSPPSGGMAEDGVLLTAFAKSGDERAFAELVRRHAGPVYHAALRRAGDAGLAEEVAQNTFALLARKAAGLTDHPFLPGWLHRTATWLAGDAAAREAAHRRRMKRFAETAALHAAGEDPLEAALPHLDKALDSLRESDRRLIWMRFHEGLSFQSISGRLRRPQEAAKKATQRAVGRLGQALRRAGVTLSSVTLTAALSETLTSSAPAALVGKLPAAALAAAGPLGGKTLLLHTLSTMTAAKQILTAAVLTAAFAVPILALQENASRRNAAAVSENTTSTPSGAGTGSRKKTSPGTAAARPPADGTAGSAAVSDVLAMLRGVPSARDPFRAAALAAEAIGTADPALLASCLEAVDAMKPSLLTLCLNMALFQRWTEADPAAAMSAALQSRRSNYSAAVGTVTKIWMERDAAGLTFWLGAASAKDQQRVLNDAADAVMGIDSARLAGVVGGWTPQALREWVSQASGHSPKVMEIARELPDGPARQILMESAAGAAGSQPAPMLEWCLTRLEGRERSQALSQIVFSWSQRDGQAAKDWYLRQPPGTVPVIALAGAEALRDDARYAEFRQGLSASDQAELDLQRVGRLESRQAAERISSLPPGAERTKLYWQIARQWCEGQPAEASAWVDALPAGAERDSASAGLARTIQKSDAPSAIVWAESIADEKRRAKTLTEIWQSWRARDGVAATRWLRDEAKISQDSRILIEAAETASEPAASN